MPTSPKGGTGITPAATPLPWTPTATWVANKTGPYRVLQPGLAINDNTNFDPLTEQEKTALLSFGPYTLEPGQDVRIVTAFAAGQIPYRLPSTPGVRTRTASLSS